LEFKVKSNTKSTMIEIDTTVPTEERTPREVMEDAYVTIRSGLVSELLEQIMDSSPSFFERLVVDLLVRMAPSSKDPPLYRMPGHAKYQGTKGSCIVARWPFLYGQVAISSRRLTKKRSP
jgi:restriction endonuclease Mrr